MSLTAEQIRASMTPLVDRLVGWRVLGYGAAGDDLGYVALHAPSGFFVQVILPVTTLSLTPLEPVLADVQSRLRAALRPYEGECGRGFDKRGRGTLAVGEPGTSASEGWV